MDGSYPHPGGPTGTRKVYPDKAIGNCGLKTVFPKLLEARKQASKRRGREGYGGGGMSIFDLDVFGVAGFALALV